MNLRRGERRREKMGDGRSEGAGALTVAKDDCSGVGGSVALEPV